MNGHVMHQCDNLLLQQAELSLCMLSAVDVFNPNLKHKDGNYNHFLSTCSVPTSELQHTPPSPVKNPPNPNRLCRENRRGGGQVYLPSLTAQ